MIIDTLVNTDVYVEKKKLITITANNVKNNKGILEIDDIDNPLISRIDSGDTPLYRIRNYNGVDELLLYNPTTKEMNFLKTNSFININLDFVRGIQYFIGAKRIVVKEHTNNVFNINLNNLNIFKVYLDNGVELKSYNLGNGTITINGLEKSYIDDFSELIIFVYKDNKITDNISFIIEYYNYNTIYDSVEFMTGEYFNNEFFGEELYCFDKFIVNENIEKETNRNNFRVSDKVTVKRVDNTVDLELFDTSDTVDLVQYVGKDEFRFILVNPVFGRIFIVNNCFMNNGIPITFQKEKNTKNCNISCGNYIDIKLTESVEYSRGKYGKGQYGSGTWVINSGRREV